MLFRSKSTDLKTEESNNQNTFNFTTENNCLNLQARRQCNSGSSINPKLKKCTKTKVVELNFEDSQEDFQSMSNTDRGLSNNKGKEYANSAAFLDIDCKLTESKELFNIRIIKSSCVDYSRNCRKN